MTSAGNGAGIFALAGAAWFAKVHPVRRVPTRVTWIVGVGSALIAGFLPTDKSCPYRVTTLAPSARALRAFP